MGVYEARRALETRDLNQGDILRGVLHAFLPSEKQFAIQNGTKITWPAPATALATLDPNLRLICKLERVDALVVSNSCDNATGRTPVLLAPIRPFEFRQGVNTDEERWRDISEAATGTANCKFYYLPGEPAFQMERSEAILPELFALSHGVLERMKVEAGARRLCGLDSRAVLHLQWMLGVFLGRNPRDDDEWPSDEDLALKAVWLRSVIPTAGKRRATYEEMLQRIDTRLGAQPQTQAVATGDEPPKAEDAVAGVTTPLPIT